MKVYRNSKIDTYCADQSYFATPCEVKIIENEIVVSYKTDNGFVLYKGEELGDGHYSLSASATGGRATLHRVPREDTLEGSWVEDRQIGMWRIDLEE
jgi:hypothetical protein